LVSAGRSSSRRVRFSAATSIVSLVGSSFSSLTAMVALLQITRESSFIVPAAAVLAPAQCDLQSIRVVARGIEVVARVVARGIEVVARVVATRIQSSQSARDGSVTCGRNGRGDPSTRRFAR
jgi:hypothetical protein